MRVLKSMLTVLVVLLLSANAQASLEVIGTATYLDQDYNLIHMDDGPFGPITWLDYTSYRDTWQTQVNWASSLDGQLTVTLNPGYTSSVDWNTGWRLPLVDESQANLSGRFGYEGPDGNGYHDYKYGYNMVNSEMGHLYYEELGNKGYYETDGTNPQPGYGLYNTGVFKQLYSVDYWSGTEYSPNSALAWSFYFLNGDQRNGDFYDCYALAVRPGYVSAVPIPGTVLLLGAGLAGLGVFCRGGRRRYWIIG